MQLQAQTADYAAAAHWVASLAARTHSDALGDATPCAEYSVRALLGHLIGTSLRSVGTARGESPRGVPHVVEDVPDGELATVYAAFSEEALTAWANRNADEDPVVAPWGSCTALEAVRGFTVETLVHGWDLAMATGQDPEGCRGAAERALGFVAIPERLVGVMYDPPAPCGHADGPTTKLARTLGRADWARS